MRTTIAVLALAMIACGPQVWPASGPRTDVEYWRAECRESSDCWSVIHEQCPGQVVIDEREGQQVTKGAIVNGIGAVNSHAEQAWIFHCVGKP